jgi:organic radical activating enzyme
MKESDIKKFYENNKSYCSMPFKEIYGDNAGKYKLCCHATDYHPITKYNTNNTTPFDYFNSPEMEQVRNKMLAGEKIDACKVCYKLEETGESYRTGKYKKKYGFDTELNRICLKLRIHGSYCNLSCYMCAPFNSSTRRNELKAIYGQSGIWGAPFKSVNHKQWNDIIKDILDNIDLVSYMNITGGEPLQLPKHWEFLDLIPKEHAKHITLSYDTNLTELRYKNKSIFDYVDKFEKIRLGVSCDHYGKKLDWMRYPIDRKKFEHNLLEAKGLIKQLNCSTSMLNIFELKEMYNYYMDNFGIPTTFVNIVRGPEMLSIKNLKQKDKDILLKKYEKLAFYDYIKAELLLEPFDSEFKLMKKYCDDLSKHRKFNWRELWNEF